jgi:hypothetical protein
MIGCTRCGVATEAGQFYSFYHGTFVDDPDGPRFEARGTEQVFYCDRCLVQAAAREEGVRAGLHLILGLVAAGTVAILAWVASPGLWAGLVVLAIVALLRGAVWQRYATLRNALRRADPAQLRQVVNSDAKLQRTGDAWAIAQRRLELQQQGETAFLTREEMVDWSRNPCP